MRILFKILLQYPSSHSRLSLENTFNYSSYTASGDFDLLQQGVNYEIEYNLCFNVCNGSIPTCNVQSKFITIP